MRQLSLILFLASVAAWGKPEIVTLRTRPKVKLSFLLDQPAQLRKGTLVLFVGGNGGRAFTHRKGKVALGGNFLARSVPRFVARGYAVALLDLPSDLPNGYSDRFRNSEAHQKDVSSVVEYLIQRGLDNLYFIGTSRGTLSAAWLAGKTDPLYLKGVILTASVSAPLSPDILKAIKHPALLVHHAEDPCRTASYEAALELKRHFTASPRFSFVGVTGGTTASSGVRNCSPQTAHGFVGKEDLVASTIVDWIEGQEPAPKI